MSKIGKTKALLKLELKPVNDESKKFLDDMFESYGKIVDIVSSYNHRLAVLNYSNEQISEFIKILDIPNKYSDKQLSEFIKKHIIKHYADYIKWNYYTEILNGLAQIIYNNTKVSLQRGSFPKFDNIKNVIPIRIGKFTPQNKKKSDKKQTRIYSRYGKILYKDNRFILRIGSNKDSHDFEIWRIGNDKERLLMLVNAIHGVDNLTIGDPSNIIKRGKRYYFYPSITKYVDKIDKEQIKNKEKIRVIGVDIGISKYIAVMFCVEYDSNTKKFKLIDAKGLRSRHFVNLVKKYENKKRVKQSRKDKSGNSDKKYALTNKSNDSLRVDHRRQLIGYVCNNIIAFAKKYNADVVAVEYLKGLNKQLSELKKEKKQLGKKYQEHKDYRILKQKRIIEFKQRLLSFLPYRKLQDELKNDCNFEGIYFMQVSAKDTSRRCICCFNIDENNRKGAKFKCSSCKFEMNADFNASVNIALNSIMKLKSSLDDLKMCRERGSCDEYARTAISPTHASINAGSVAGNVFTHEYTSHGQAKDGCDKTSITLVMAGIDSSLSKDVCEVYSKNNEAIEDDEVK